MARRTQQTPATAAGGTGTAGVRRETSPNRPSHIRQGVDPWRSTAPPPADVATIPVRPRRKPGTGSIYYDEGHQCWRGTLSLPPVNGRRRRALFIGTTYDEVEQQIDAVLCG